MERVSARQVGNQWRRLLKRKRNVVADWGKTPSHCSEVVDPFDCSDLVLPSTKGMVEQHVDRACQEWQALDARRIKSDNPNQSTRLPPGFDYATLKSPPEETATDHDDRIISLEDPTKSSSYATALWHTFSRVPTVAQMERDLRNNAKIQHTLALQEEIQQGLAENPRLDGHALGRMRMADRHALPPTTTVNDGNDDDSVDLQSSSLTFECCRWHPSRGSTSDPHRLVVELAGTQTLFDLHRLLCEMAEDTLWENHVHTQNDITVTTEGGGSDGESQPEQQPEATAGSDEQNDEETAQKEDDSGMFFMENVFYTCGDIDYAKPIQDWLLAATARRKRLRFLNLDDRDHDGESLNKTQQHMKDHQLQDLKLRLGVRYMHVCHGDVEVSVFLVDRRFGGACRGDNGGASTKYPILHDVWMPTNLPPDCYQPDCSRFASRVVVVKGDEGNGNNQLVALCQECSQKEGTDDNARVSSVDYEAWKAESDISISAIKEKRF